MLVGFAAFAEGQALGMQALLYYGAAYTFMNIGAFAVIAALQKRLGVTSNLSTFAGLARRELGLALIMTLLLLSLTGIPPTAGFFGKYLIILSAVQAGGWLNPLAVLIVLNAAIAAFYYLRVVVYMFMRDPSAEQPALQHGRLVWTGLAVATFATIVLGLFPGPLLDIVTRAAAAAGSRSPGRRPSGGDGDPRQDRLQARRHHVRPDAPEGAVADDAVRVDPEVDRQGDRLPGGLSRPVGVEPAEATPPPSARHVLGVGREWRPCRVAPRSRHERQLVLAGGRGRRRPGGREGEVDDAPTRGAGRADGAAEPDAPGDEATRRRSTAGRGR